MDKKIIFLDIDGTLTEPGKNEAPESALKAIKGAQEKGNYVFLCSGRNYEMLSPMLRYGFDGVIASAGGYIKVGDKVIYDCPMTESQRQTALDILHENGIFRTVECLDGSYTDESFKLFLKENAKEGGNSELLRWREQLERSLNILPMKEYRNQPVYKIVIMSKSMEQIEKSKEGLEKDFIFCLQEADQYGFVNGEVINREFDKGKGMVRVCDYLGIPIENSIAIGDSMNDKEMLEQAEVGICMENGSQKLKEIADDICPSVTKDGIYHAFSRYHLF